MPFIACSYNRTLPNINNIFRQHWQLLKIDSILKNTFLQTPILTFRRNRKINDIISGNKTEFNKVKRKSFTMTKRKSTPCLQNNRTLCCRQIIKTATFQSNQNKRTYTIYHNVNCKSKQRVNTKSLMKCTKCKLQYVGKAGMV